MNANDFPHRTHIFFLQCRPTCRNYFRLTYPDLSLCLYHRVHTKFSLAFQSIVFNSIKLSITNEGLCTHACYSSDPFSHTVEETTSRTGKKCIKNDIFIEFLLVRNQHLLRPSIIIIIVVIAVLVVDDDDDEIKLLNIQKYRFWSNGFKAYTFQLGFFSFSVWNKQEKWKWNNERNRSDLVAHGHCRLDRFYSYLLLCVHILKCVRPFCIKSIWISCRWVFHERKYTSAVDLFN